MISRSSSLAISLDLHPDGRVLAFTAALSLLTGILFGLAPAIRSTGVSLSPGLGRRGAAAGGLRLGKLLVISQVALSLVLLIGAGLFVRTLRNLKAQDLGVDRDHLLLVWTAPGQMGRQGPELVRFFGAIQDRISSLPGVLSASPSNFGLLGGAEHSSTTSLAAVQDYPIQSERDKWVPWTLVGRRFFETLGIPLAFGRDFTPGDTATAPQVVIVNEAMARYYFGAQNPVGRRIVGGLGKVDHSIEIVGVVKDARYSSLRQQDARMIYFPYPQDPRPHHLWEWGMCLAVRTAGNPAGVAAAIGKDLREIAPNLPVLRIDTIEQQVGESLTEERLIAALSGFFGVVAAMLVSIGLYGMMAYTAARRTNEIGVRLALGSSRAQVLWMVLRESLLLVLAGIAIGLPVTLTATRLISARLFGVSAIDPATITAASLLMISVAALAGLVPAHKASRVDPMVALRYD
jgi:predicted permease